MLAMSKCKAAYPDQGWEKQFCAGEPGLQLCYNCPYTVSLAGRVDFCWIECLQLVRDARGSGGIARHSCW